MKTKGIEIPQFYFPEGKITELEMMEEQNVYNIFIFIWNFEFPLEIDQ